MSKTLLTCAGILSLAAAGCGGGAVDLERPSAETSATATLIAPDQDLSDFPPWIWPIIHPVDLVANVITGREIEFDKAAEVIALSAGKLCECSTTGQHSFESLLEMIDASLDVQYSSMKFAKLKAAGIHGKGIAYWDDDDWCGTPPKPWPWPRRWLDLIEVQIQTVHAGMLEYYDLDRDQTRLLEEHLGAQWERFEALAQ